MKRLHDWYLKTPALFRYLVNSGVVTVMDIIIVWVLVQCSMPIVLANTIGVVIGFLVDYLLSVIYVFDSAKGRGGFAIYLITFFIGLLLADFLIWWGNGTLFVSFSETINFFMSKGLSIVVPFFIMYGIRKYLYQKRKERMEDVTE